MRDQSLLMLGKGLEDVFIGTIKIKYNKTIKTVIIKIQALGWNHCLLGGVSSGII